MRSVCLSFPYISISNPVVVFQTKIREDLLHKAVDEMVLIDN